VVTDVNDDASLFVVLIVLVLSISRVTFCFKPEIMPCNLLDAFVITSAGEAGNAPALAAEHVHTQHDDDGWMGGMCVGREVRPGGRTTELGEEGDAVVVDGVVAWSSG